MYTVYCTKCILYTVQNVYCILYKMYNALFASLKSVSLQVFFEVSSFVGNPVSNNIKVKKNYNSKTEMSS